jgi:hypothetical protein
MSPGFGMSARKWENGFVGDLNCFVAAAAAKHRWRKCEAFQQAGRLPGHVAEQMPCSAAGYRPSVAAYAFSPAGENR